MSDAEFRSAVIRLKQRASQSDATASVRELIVQADAMMAGRLTMLTRTSMERRLVEELDES